MPNRTYRHTILSYEVCFSPYRGNSSNRMLDSRRKISPALSFLSAPWCPRHLGSLSSLLLLLVALTSVSFAQDWVRTGSGLGVDKVRLAVPDFKPSSADPQNAALLKTFNDTFWNDLDNSGVVELVSKSFIP